MSCDFDPGDFLQCPGWYCGRQCVNGTLSKICSSCPRGFRRNETNFICEPCSDSPSFYDWLYMTFVMVQVLVLHWFFIDMVSIKRTFSKAVLVLHATALLEVVLAASICLVLSQPLGQLFIESCRVRSIADWYTLLHNPTPNFEDKIHCTQEAVYPLYSIIFMFYILCLLLMLLIRPWICRKFLPRQSKMSVYAAMYFIPILVLIHALIGGLLYYAFPYLVVILSVISCAAHFAVKLDQSVSSLFLTTIKESRNIVILLGHWSLHAFGIIAITQLTNPNQHLLLLLLVPVPALFYIFTAKFTDPKCHF